MDRPQMLWTGGGGNAKDQEQMMWILNKCYGQGEGEMLRTRNKRCGY